MNLKALTASVDVIGRSGPQEVEVAGIVCDSRKVQPGWLFVAVSGTADDGVKYITEALANGAVAVVSENKLNLGAAVVHLQVPQARRALAQLSNTFYGDLSRQMKIIGITGTNGKTTTAFLVRDLLRSGGLNPGLLGTVVYEIGDRTIPASRTTPEAPGIHALFQYMHMAGCDSAVMEVSSHAIDQQRVYGIGFAVRVFTNLTQDHLDYHSTMENYYAVKSELFSGAFTGPVVINCDDPWGRRLLESGAITSDVTTVGFDESATVRATGEKLGARGTVFRVHSPWGSAKVQLQLLGRFNIHNALAAIAVGGLLGIPLPVMAQSLAGITSVPGRLELVPNRRRRKVFVDYAHTDDALRNVLSTLREICKGKIILVFGCGGNRDRGKRPLMGKVAAELADFSIVTSDNPRNEEPDAIAREIIAGFGDCSSYKVVLDRHTAIEAGLQRMGRKDILLVAGKGHETYQEAKGTIVPFDDRDTVREIASR